MPPPSVSPSTHYGLGAILNDGGASFRVWAPHAGSVAVITKDDERAEEIITPLASEDSEFWSADLSGVVAGVLYRFHIDTADPPVRNDPYAAAISHLPGGAWSVVTPREFDWGSIRYNTPTWDEWVIYELHAGTFN